jgi:light-regulated signal transduction histidine kinase (bacteriophytochrome)
MSDALIQKIDTLKDENRKLKLELKQKTKVASRAMASYQQRALHMEIIRQQNEDLDRLAKNLAKAKRFAEDRAREGQEAAHQQSLINKQLELSNSELESFAYIASHDLQEPLRKVIAFGDRLKAIYADALGERGLDYLERMQNATKRMQTLINDLLSFSRVTSKAQPFAEVDLRQVTQEVISDLEVRIQDLQGKVEVSDLPTVDADPLQMRQLMQNLIGNALKFHKKDKPPHVRIAGTVINGNGDNSDRGGLPDKHCQITIEDNGIGFDEQYADRIFGMFQQLHGRQEYEGTGIGLSICKKIAERHHGDIKAESIQGHRTTFVITLPVKQSEKEVSREV